MYGEHDGREQLRPLVRGFEIDLLAATTRNHAAEFKPDEETGKGYGEAGDP